MNGRAEREGGREKEGSRVAVLDKQCCSAHSQQFNILMLFEEVMKLASHTEE